LSERPNQRFGHAVAEIFLFWCVRQILERQHRENLKWLAGEFQFHTGLTQFSRRAGVLYSGENTFWAGEAQPTCCLFDRERVLV